MSQLTMDKLVALCKSRGFVYPGSEIYGGLANAWDYGPLGVEPVSYTHLDVYKRQVLMMLRRRYEYWFLIVALHKIGAIAIPATHLLTEKDIVYRVNAANVKCVITIDDNNMVPEVDEMCIRDRGMGRKNS